MESGIVVHELASRTESWEWELTSEKDDSARFLPRNRHWPPQGEEPLGIRELRSRSSCGLHNCVSRRRAFVTSAILPVSISTESSYSESVVAW